MTGLLTAPEGIVFSSALALMLLIGAIEAVGLGAAGLDADLDVGLDHDGVLGWLGVGRVPLLVLLVVFLAAFGVIGLAGQEIMRALSGHLLPPLLAVPAAGVAALPATALLSRGLARILPRDETTAIPVEELIGRTGTITVGRATAGSPARARVIDAHGQAHHLLVEPDQPDSRFDEGDTVLLVRREGHHFRAILHDRARFSEWTVS